MNSIAEPEKYELSDQDLQALQERGYKIVEQVGEGHTRIAFRIQLEKGNAKRTLIMKIPKRAVDANSVCTLINRSKGDLDQREVSLVNQLVHPNIIRVFDSFSLNDGRTVNVEDDIQGTDLETLVNISGPIRDPAILKRIGDQLLGALDYAHTLHTPQLGSYGILHRDVKPSNWYMKKDGTGMLGDWQNAAKRRSIEETMMPTRGGTQHTLPTLLNSLLNGSPSCASDRSEVYAAASTLYYALTGKDAFDYKIVKSDSGREIEVGQERFKVKLDTSENDGSGIITPEMHERKVKKAIKSLPPKYRSFFKKAFTLDERMAFQDVGEAVKAWDRVSDSSFYKLKESVIKGVKYAIPAIVAAGITGSVIYSVATRDPEPRPTMREMMDKEDYANFSLDDKLTPESWEYQFNAEEIFKAGKNAQKSMATSEQEIKEELGEINSLLKLAKNTQRMDPRLIASWVRACYVCDAEKKLGEEYKRKGESRLGEILVPERFVQVNSRDGYLKDINHFGYGVMYLKSCIGPNKTVADVLTEYFCSREEVSAAKIRTQSMDYLSTLNPSKSIIDVGYSKMLPYEKQRVITTALALYSITDNEGNINWDKLPDYRKITNPNMTALPVPAPQGAGN